MTIAIIILILCISLYVLARTVELLETVIPPGFFLDLLKQKDETGTEIPTEDPVKQKYDVEGFRKRIDMLKRDIDEDGLFDVKEPIRPTDFTGAEVITEQYEAEMDRLIR